MFKEGTLKQKTTTIKNKTLFSTEKIITTLLLIVNVAPGTKL